MIKCVTVSGSRSDIDRRNKITRVQVLNDKFDKEVAEAILSETDSIREFIVDWPNFDYLWDGENIGN